MFPQRLITHLRMSHPKCNDLWPYLGEWLRSGQSNLNRSWRLDLRLTILNLLNVWRYLNVHPVTEAHN